MCNSNELGNSLCWHDSDRIKMLLVPPIDILRCCALELWTDKWKRVGISSQNTKSVEEQTLLEMDSDSFWKSNWRKSNYAQSTLWFSFSFVFSDLTNPWKNSKNAEHPMEHKEILGNSLSYCSQWILYVLHIRLTQVGSGYRRREISQPTWFRWFFSGF